MQQKRFIRMRCLQGNRVCHVANALVSTHHTLIQIGKMGVEYSPAHLIHPAGQLPRSQEAVTFTPSVPFEVLSAAGPIARLLRLFICRYIWYLKNSQGCNKLHLHSSVSKGKY